MKRFFSVLFLFYAMAFLSVCAQPSAPKVRLSLARCQEDGLASSDHLKQLQARVDSAQSSYKASRSAFYPSLTLDVQGSWVSEVPSLQIGSLQAQFGDNWNYSAGPTVRYVLFDNGARTDISRSAASAVQARAEEAAFARKQILLQVRQAYFAVQNDLAKLQFLNGQTAVSLKQLADVEASFAAGAKSRLDVFVAQKQLAQAQAETASARGALGTHLRELFRLTNSDYSADPRYPAAEGLTGPAQMQGATTLLSAETLEQTLLDFAPLSAVYFDENSPRLAALEDMSSYYEFLAESYRSALYPRVSLQGGAYFEYPNGPIKEHIFLGKASAALSLPLFEGGQNRKQAEAQRHLARAAQYEKQDAKRTLEALFYSSKDELLALSAQEKYIKQMIDAAARTAELTYQAYKAGTATFFDVERANLDLLKSRFEMANLQTRQLNNLALLDSLGKENL